MLAYCSPKRGNKAGDRRLNQVFQINKKQGIMEYSLRRVCGRYRGSGLETYSARN